MDKGDIDCYLSELRDCINSGRYNISVREKNEKLHIEYYINEEMIKKILLSLEVSDFSNTVFNDNPKFPDEVLYVFGKDVTLMERVGENEKNVTLYIKINMIKRKHNYAVVVSFHECEYQLKYAFA